MCHLLSPEDDPWKFQANDTNKIKKTPPPLFFYCKSCLQLALFTAIISLLTDTVDVMPFPGIYLSDLTTTPDKKTTPKFYLMSWWITGTVEAKKGARQGLLTLQSQSTIKIGTRAFNSRSNETTAVPTTILLIQSDYENQKIVNTEDTRPFLLREH